MGMQKLQFQFQGEMFYLGDSEEEVEEIKIKSKKDINHLGECDQAFWIVISLKQHNQIHNLHSKEKDKEKILLVVWKRAF